MHLLITRMGDLPKTDAKGFVYSLKELVKKKFALYF